MAPKTVSDELLLLDNAAESSVDPPLNAHDEHRRQQVCVVFD